MPVNGRELGRLIAEALNLRRATNIELYFPVDAPSRMRVTQYVDLTEDEAGQLARILRTTSWQLKETEDDDGET